MCFHLSLDPPGPQVSRQALSPPGTPLPPRPRPRLPPPSPSRQKLCAPEEVMDQQGDWVTPGRVGRVAIRLAKECVFGSDVMATGKLYEEGLNFASPYGKLRNKCVSM